MAKLYLLTVLCAIYCVWSRSTGEKYDIQYGNFTMNGAAGICQLATPVFSYIENGIKLNMTNDELSHVPDKGDTFWTGYVKVFYAFQYRGCVPKSEIVSNQTRYIEQVCRSSPGMCFSCCSNSIVFGLSGGTCYCLPSFGNATVNLANSGCNHLCSDHGGALCGASDGSFVSIYEKVVYHPGADYQDNDAQKLCLAYHTKFMKFKWSKCSSYNRHNCQQDKSDTVTEDKRIWSTIMEQCLDDNNLPAFRDKSYDMTLTGSDKALWIGEVRDQVIAIESSTSKDMVLQRGYLELDDGVFYLSFGDDTAHEQRSAICYEEDTTVSSSSSSSSSITSSDETATIANTTPTETDDTFPTTGTASHMETTNDDLIDGDNGQPLIVGVSVGVPVLVTLIVIVVCVSKKRKQPRGRSAKLPINVNANMLEENDGISTAHAPVNGNAPVARNLGMGLGKVMQAEPLDDLDDDEYESPGEEPQQGDDGYEHAYSGLDRSRNGGSNEHTYSEMHVEARQAENEGYEHMYSRLNTQHEGASDEHAYTAINVST